MYLDHQVINCPIGKKCFLVDVLLTKNVDHINWTLNLVELHQYLISLLRKMQNTFLELAVSGFGRWESFPKKENFHHMIENYFWIMFHFDSYINSLLRNRQNKIKS